MAFLKQNRIKIELVILILLVVLIIGRSKNNQLDTALINTPLSSPILSENEQKLIELEKSLPRFEDYPATVYPIPPKPIVNHQSDPYGMRYWTVTENMASTSLAYDMAGHYLMKRYATGNPDVLVIDGLTGRVFNEPGSINFMAKTNSSLVIFDPFEPECFSPTGDYVQCYAGRGNPRYAKWNGQHFVTLCNPVIKNWKLVSCNR